MPKKKKKDAKKTTKKNSRGRSPKSKELTYGCLRQEHDEVMRAIGHLPEGDGQEHAEIMDIISGREHY